ncbi:hypothetical protein GCM10027275_08500 [Rhabdobacter roseus]|uniref:Sulfur carrier protein n=1 Tax=Rhabdobacter roseus TaxID=1655419 RepID=A0A840TRV5_9BACT|nr:sulfur carrier protein ThiS [Rhabdobacter roseus]MBB5282750.1 sulfur carrier protein [Rhabdobacter roseus]
MLAKGKERALLLAEAGYLLKCKSVFTMEVFINHQPFPVSEQDTLLTLLAAHHLAERKGIAVAVNDTVVTRPDWGTFPLSPNDQITLIRATQGG